MSSKRDDVTINIEHSDGKVHYSGPVEHAEPLLEAAARQLGVDTPTEQVISASQERVANSPIERGDRVKCSVFKPYYHVGPHRRFIADRHTIVTEKGYVTRGADPDGDVEVRFDNGRIQQIAPSCLKRVHD